MRHNAGAAARAEDIVAQSNRAKPELYTRDVDGKPERWEPFPPYQAKFDHSLWKDLPPKTLERGHGGTDVIELAEFVRAVRAKTQTPIDVYDSVVMSVVFPLSEQSIAAGSAPVKCPDFTSGKWETTKPKFAVEP